MGAKNDRAWRGATRTGSRVCAAVLLFGASGCNEYGIPAGTSPHREFNFLDMGDQPKVKAQRGDLMGGPVFNPSPGAIPRGYDPYRYEGQPELAGQEMRNPLPTGDTRVLERGKLMFERYCVPCHDENGAGNGLVVEKGFPAPPSLMTQKLRDWSDGRIYHVVVDGQNIMPSYATQIRPRDRWSAVLYVRDLQSRLPVAQPPDNPTPEGSGAAPATAAPEQSAAPSASGIQPTSVEPPEAASGAPATSTPTPEGEVR